MKNILLSTALFSVCFFTIAQDDILPLRGLAISAPDKENINRFVKFIDEELAPRAINTLILRVDYNYQYTSHPELARENGLSQDGVNKL